MSDLPPTAVMACPQELRVQGNVTDKELLDQTVWERNSLREVLFQERIINNDLRERLQAALLVNEKRLDEISAMKSEGIMAKMKRKIGV